MNSLNRIFNSINEAKKTKKKKGMVGPTPKGAANRYDHDSFGKKNEEKRYADYDSQLQGEYEAEENDKANRQLSRLDAMKKASKGKPLSPKQRQIAKLAGNPNKIGAADLAKLRKMGRGKKINASTEVADILNTIKEAYESDLISEEAFIAIADPILKSLVEKKIAVRDPATGKTHLVDQEDLEDDRRTKKRAYKRKDDRRKQ